MENNWSEGGGGAAVPERHFVPGGGSRPLVRGACPGPAAGVRDVRVSVTLKVCVRVSALFGQDPSLCLQNETPLGALARAFRPPLQLLVPKGRWGFC